MLNCHFISIPLLINEKGMKSKQKNGLYMEFTTNEIHCHWLPIEEFLEKDAFFVTLFH